MILDILLFYFVGKAFYELAREYNRSRWGFAILGVVSCYGGIMVGGVIWALIYEIGLSKSIEDINEILLSLMALPFGILICWGFYHILKRSWSRSSSSSSSDALDADLFKDKEE